MKRLLLLVLASTSYAVGAQVIPASILHEPWKASWITVAGAPAYGYGIYLFRKTIELQSRPASFVVHVSADNRYKLFVNERLVSLGPARGDLSHWNYETVDLAPYFIAGRNIIAAQVWNEGEWRPEAQISLRTGFILQGSGPSEQLVNTGNTWKGMPDSSYQPARLAIAAYYVAGPGEQITMPLHPKDWQKAGYPDAHWKPAEPMFTGIPRNVAGGYGTTNGWMLMPSGIPQMEMTLQRLQKVLRAEAVAPPAGFPAAKVAVAIPANTVATLLLDQAFLTNAYPTLVFSGGKGGSVSLTYAEALFTRYPAKGGRNETDGKTMLGRKDSIIADGTAGQVFTTLAWRTYRFIQLRITTREDPLTIDDIYGTFTGYPFSFNAKLQTDDPGMQQILEIGWRTARLCAVETYMDCPYYEQLQYIGDARIQGLVSLYNSGDDRLLLNAMNQMDWSRQPEGVTLSRHPSYTPQYIPTFSLWYIGLLHDYWMYGKDTGFVRDKLAGERQILNYFRGYQQPDGSLKGVPNWMFTDWVTTPGWKSGVGPAGKAGTSAMIDLQLLWAYQLAAGMERRIGIKAYASLYDGYAAQLKKAVREKYWDNNRSLFADRPEKDLFSQHTNTLAILTGLVDGPAAAAIAQKLVTDTTLAPASIYFRYYLHQALVKAGMGDDYLRWLGPWRENIHLGLTTWAEIPDINNSRSDCHAWGSSPNIEFFRTVLGVDSDAPGFASVKITPHLGALKHAQGEIPHPRGTLSVQYDYTGNKWSVAISVPAQTTGTLVWKGKTYPLKAGRNAFTL